MDSRHLTQLFRAMGNEIRVRIVELVSAHKEMCICELVDELGMSQANISRHVAVLRQAGVLLDRKVGAWVMLRVDEQVLRTGCKQLVEAVRANHRRSSKVDAERRLAERCDVP